MTNSPWDDFLSQGLAGQRPASNIPADTSIVSVSGLRLPVTLNFVGAADTSWVASLRNSYGPYARAETDLVGMTMLAKALSRGASVVAEQIFTLAGLRGGLYLNNWQLATNLYAPEFNIDVVQEACARLHAAYPKLPVIIRSLTPPIHKELIAGLDAAGFLLIPTRQVWLMEDLATGGWRRRRDVKNDIALEARSAGEWVPGLSFTSADYCRTVKLYNQLYRGKYPSYNPCYGEAFFRTAVASGWLQLWGLRIPNVGLVGVVGVIQQGDWYATPVLGYDLTQAQKAGLYRRLSLRAFQIAEAAGGKLHCSGGAGHFKKQRGAYPVVEYAAVDVSELTRSSKWALTALSKLLSAVVAPYLERRML